MRRGIGRVIDREESGFHDVALLQPNVVPFRKADSLKPGTQIIIPAMYKIFDGGSRLVQIGDSLWRIAQKDLGNGASYKEIVERNGQFIEAPDRVYPVQMFQLSR